MANVRRFSAPHFVVAACLTLVVAFNYGARQEIAQAARRIAIDVAQGRLQAEAVSPDLFGRYLHAPDIPDPDLIIRTGGELRLSNFLLFQSAYAEFWATTTYWPEFDEHHLKMALDNFAARQRRYGT